MYPIDHTGLKAQLPPELREAMKLDRDQFEELEIDTLQTCVQFIDCLNGCDPLPDKPSDVEVAFRPTRNPRGQYFAVEYSMMVEPVSNAMRCEVMAFKPMNRVEYIAYCIQEYGEAPEGFVDPQMN